MWLKQRCEELTHLKRPWCWERLRAGGEGDDRGWDGWMASPTQWTWVWVNSWSWWWTGRPGVLQSMGSQRVGHNWATELNWSREVPFLSRPHTSEHTISSLNTTAKESNWRLLSLRMTWLRLHFWNTLLTHIQNRFKGQNIANKETILVVWIRENWRLLASAVME